MVIIAKFPSRCVVCSGNIQVGERIEWVKGNPVRHTACEFRAAGDSIPGPVVRSATPQKRCWECGRMSTFSDARKFGGEWDDSYCGC